MRRFHDEAGSHHAALVEVVDNALEQLFVKDQLLEAQPAALIAGALGHNQDADAVKGGARRLVGYGRRPVRSERALTSGQLPGPAARNPGR